MATIRKRTWQTKAGESRTAWICGLQRPARRAPAEDLRHQAGAADAWLDAASRAQVASRYPYRRSPRRAERSARRSSRWLAAVPRPKASSAAPGSMYRPAPGPASCSGSSTPDTKLARIDAGSRTEQPPRRTAGPAHARPMAQQDPRAAFKAALRRRQAGAAWSPRTLRSRRGDRTGGRDKRRQRRLEVGVDVPTPAEVTDAARRGRASGRGRSWSPSRRSPGSGRQSCRGPAAGRTVDLGLPSPPSRSAQRADTRGAQIGSARECPRAAAHGPARRDAPPCALTRMAPRAAAQGERWRSAPPAIGPDTAESTSGSALVGAGASGAGQAGPATAGTRSGTTRSAPGWRAGSTRRRRNTGQATPRSP